MDAINFNSLEKMTEYEEKIKDFSVEQLIEEKEKISKKLKINYICMNDRYYFANEINISGDQEELSRVINRKRISFVSAILSGCIKSCGKDFALAWSHINKMFTNSISVPIYATLSLDKQVSLSDKLNNQGCVAYKRFLMLIYDNLNNLRYGFKTAVYEALTDEIRIDKDFDRRSFFTRNFLPKGIGAAQKNILKLEVVKRAIKEKTSANELN